MRAAFLTLMNQAVQHAPFVGRSSHGQPSFDAAITRRARVEYETKLVRNKDGAEKVSTLQVYVEGTQGPVGEQDQLTLPDGTSPTIFAVANVPDLNGTLSHCEVAF